MIRENHIPRTLEYMLGEAAGMAWRATSARLLEDQTGKDEILGRALDEAIEGAIRQAAKERGLK